MVIKSVHVRNFRSIRDETLPCKELTVLVGRNGAGKSSFLRALDLFYQPNARYVENDFYNGDTEQNISVAVNFTDLTEEEKELFARYIENGQLVVEKVMSWPLGKGSQRYYGYILQNPDFNHFRLAGSAGEKKEEYEMLRSNPRYSSLPPWKNQGEALKNLEEWESQNPETCERCRDDGQFFGFGEVGKAHLEYFTRFLFVPAVRDASEEAADAKGRALSELIDLVVRREFAEREDWKTLRDDVRRRYEEIMTPEGIPQLVSLSERLTDTLRGFVPEAEVELSWQKTQGIDLPLPKAHVKLIEDGYPSDVERTGHGLQRAFILTMLQHLAVAQAPLEETAPTGGEEWLSETIPTPDLVLVIEEPELYQHPNRQRHLAEILLRLAHGSIEGVARRTQVLYCTHSPLFVDIERFDRVRILRKVAASPDLPKETRLSYTSLDDVAHTLAKCQENISSGTFTARTLIPRLHHIMTPWTNEGFFANVVVLVEGESDRAAILATASLMEYSFEAEGISVIPCMGKNSIDKPAVIFRGLDIPVYAVWDNDEGKKDVSPEANRRLLRLFNQEPEDWPCTVTDSFACFARDLESTLRSEIGEVLFEELLSKFKEEMGLKKDDALKNPSVIEGIIKEAEKRERTSSTLHEVVERIYALKSRYA